MIRVLLVEDDRADARLVMEAFRHVQGTLCVPNHVETLAAAVEWVRDVPSDVILLDLSLPDSRGIDTLKGMLEAAPDTSIVILSGFDDPEFATMALEVGAQDYIVKGDISGDALTRAVRYAITRKHLEDDARLADQRVRNIIERAHDAIVVVNPRSTIVMANPAAERLFGWPAELLIGRDVTVLLPLARREGHADLVAGVFESNEIPSALVEGQEVDAVHRDGRPISVELTLSRTPTPDGLLFTAFIRDVTERRKAAEALRAAKDAAETALMELGRAQARLVQAEKMSALGQLVAGVAHEMNTPIGNALTAASFLDAATAELREKLAQPSGFRRSDLTDYLDTVDEGARIVMNALKRATGLVQLFKQTASERADSGRCRFSLKHLLGDFVAATTPKVERAGHRLTVDCPEEVEMDSHPVALSQALTHLVGNALDHAFPRGSRTRPGVIALRARINDSDAAGDEVIIEVIDDGIGIEENERLKVFEPFHTTKRGGGHAGLGLHVVFNMVVGPLSGHIAIEDALDTDGNPVPGTRVVLDLPRVASD